MFTRAGVIDKSDTSYPDQLRQTYNPPKSLYFRGDLGVLGKPGISIVGTRRSSSYGSMVTEKIVQELQGYNFSIISGLAIGIDSHAHIAALRYKIPTIAVLGTGINNIFPRENLDLAEKILQAGGLIVSEYPENTEGQKFHFPQRNRIISGLSLATVVIEAPEQSGALITAKFALEQGREIFAVPGDIFHENSLGPLRLLQNSGAYPIASGQDIIEVLNRQPYLSKSFDPRSQEKNSPPPARIMPDLKADERNIIDLLDSHRGKQITHIVQKSGLPLKEVLVILTNLELKNLINVEQGRYYLIS